jgi:two-component system cell cycle sensor histidine kinase/response regulator CckA
VILDYHLPDVLGDVLLRDFLRERPGTLCIMTTSDPHPDLALEWARQGAAAYLQKPFDPKYLVYLCENVRRQKVLLRVPALLEERTRELQRSEEKFRQLFTQMPSAVAIYDAVDNGKDFIIKDFSIV